MNSKLKKALGWAVAAVSLGGLVIGLGGAAATASPGDCCVTGAQVVDGSLGTSDIYGPAVDYLRQTPANSVWTSSLNNYVVSQDKLHPAVAAQLKYGTVADGNIYNTPTVTIAKIGGSFATNATKLGTFTLPAGTWNLFFKERFERITSGAAGTRMQLAIRESGSGEDYGTDMGTEISPTKGRELVQSGVSIITVDGNTTLDVYGFGYNDDQSAAGSGEITGKAQVWAELVG